jgi:hypothetical protein
MEDDFNDLELKDSHYEKGEEGFGEFDIVNGIITKKEQVFNRKSWKKEDPNHSRLNGDGIACQHCRLF